MNTVAYFEIQSSNPGREVDFYRQVFGWEFSREEGLPFEYYRIISGGIPGAILARPAATPAPGQGTNAFTVSMEVEDFDACALAILNGGGQVALPKFAVAGLCWQGYFIYPDHNVFGIFQVYEKAG